MYIFIYIYIFVFSPVSVRAKPQQNDEHRKPYQAVQEQLQHAVIHERSGARQQRPLAEQDHHEPRAALGVVDEDGLPADPEPVPLLLEEGVASLDRFPAPLFRPQQEANKQGLLHKHPTPYHYGS